MEKYYMPRFLDEPWKIAFFTLDEVLVITIPVLLGLLVFNAPVIAMGVSSVCVTLLKKLKGEEGHYFIRQLVYWYLPPILFLKATPPSYVREILG